MFFVSNVKLKRSYPDDKTKELIEVSFDGGEYRTKELCVSGAMNGNIVWLGVFRLFQDRRYGAVVRGFPPLGDRDWDYSRKFGHTNPFRSLSCFQIRRNSHGQSIQDRCGDGYPRPES